MDDALRRGCFRRSRFRFIWHVDVSNHYCFVAGLMVGRTPEYLGKKIGPFEMKMASFAVLVMPMFVLIFTALATMVPIGKEVIANPGAHGFTEMLYAFTSMVNNNGSAFAGLNANTPFYNILGGIAM